MEERKPIGGGGGLCGRRGGQQNIPRSCGIRSLFKWSVRKYKENSLQSQVCTVADLDLEVRERGGGDDFLAYPADFSSFFFLVFFFYQNMGVGFPRSFPRSATWELKCHEKTLLLGLRSRYKTNTLQKSKI